MRPIEVYTHNQNLAESAIREPRRMYKRAMRETNAPHVLWDYCIELIADLRSHTALNILTLQGDTPNTRLTGDTIDISHLCEFRWYDEVWYIGPTDKMKNRKLARYLGHSHDVGQAISSRLLTNKAQVISRTSVIPLSTEDRNYKIVEQHFVKFNKEVADALGDRIAGKPPDSEEEETIVPYEDDSGEMTYSVPDIDDFDDDSYHKFTSAKLYFR
jgi:hypothetical protein